MKKLFGILIISTAIVFADTGNADSLRAEIERLTAMLQQVEQQNQTEAEIETSDIASAEKEEFEEISQESQTLISTNRKSSSLEITMDDTALTITRVKSTKDSVAEPDTSIKIIRIAPKFADEWRKGNFFGISGGPAMGAIYMDMNPLKKFYRSEGVPVAFDNREPMFLIGGFGLGGFVNGARIGGAGYSAKSEFRSYNAARDTMYVSNSQIGFGGFVVGRAWGKEKMAFHFQALIGSGNHNVKTSKMTTEDGTFWEFGGSGNQNIVFARDLSSSFFASDLQFGHTHSFTRWFHIGGEYSLLFMHSINGFGYDSFTSLSPTAKLRFVFGSLR